jgi:hypothetical protein
MKRSRPCFAVSILLMCVVFWSCSRDLGPQEFIRWVDDSGNGLHVVKESGEYTFDLRYQPAAYMVLQQAPGLRGAAFQKAVEEAAGMQYYTLTIRPREAGTDFIKTGNLSPEELQRKLYYFSYLFQQDIQVEENGETIPCVLYHFEKSGDVKAGRTFVLGFEEPGHTVEEARVVISSPWLGSLPVKIKVRKDNIPLLKI